MMKSNAVLLLVLWYCSKETWAFTTPSNGRTIVVRRTHSSPLYSDFDPLGTSSSPLFDSGESTTGSQQQAVVVEMVDVVEEDPLMIEVLMVSKRRGIRGFFYNRFAGFVSGLVGFVTQGIATDDYEYAELPPPYIPAIFGVVLLAGVGILTSTLGDVMDEEASLGLQSGARARKEIERSRSSYFGKRR